MRYPNTGNVTIKHSTGAYKGGAGVIALPVRNSTGKIRNSFPHSDATVAL
jgi:hypothetical protein